MEILTSHPRDDFQILDELVRFVLAGKLCLFVAPRFRKIIQLPQRRGTIFIELVDQKLDRIGGLQKLAGTADGVRRSG